MSCKSALYAANTSSQTLAIGSVINFGSIVRRFGCNSTLSGGNVIVNGSGYYDINTNFTFIPGATGTATITLYKDGTAIPGATQTVVATAASPASVNINCLVRDTCCCDSTITAIITSAAVVMSNAAITVEKL